MKELPNEHGEMIECPEQAAGVTSLNVLRSDPWVVLQFGQSVGWVSFTRAEALRLAEDIRLAAEKLPE